MDLFKKTPKPPKRASSSSPASSQYLLSLQPFPTAPPARFTNPFRSKPTRNRDEVAAATPTSSPPVEISNPIPSFPVASEGAGYINAGERREEEEYGLEQQQEGDDIDMKKEVEGSVREEVIIVKPKLCFSDNWSCEPFGEVAKCDNPGCGLPQIGHSKCALCGKDFCLRCWEKKVDAVH